MIDALLLAKLALATYRLARLIAVDEGPFSIFHRLRYWAGAYDLGENGAPVSALGRLLSCPHCVGVYVAVALWLGGPGWWVDVLAVAGLQSWLWSLARGY